MIKFKDLKLSAKIGGGFAIVLILTLVIGILGWNGIGGVADRVDKGDDINRLVKIILTARQQEKNFIIRGDDKYIERVKEEVASLKDQASETKGKFKDPLNKRQMDEVLAAVTEYEKEFGGYVDIEKKVREAEEKMVVA
ncbi:MAG TPA: methyl-accepting chemotaxis protein, partial [Desulfatiglandales bacterium]|nr:methyl-accepting chemotaxis protein [Desulfatiglandales bacterium]